MKKLFIPFLALCTFISIYAQDDCLTFFPNTPEAQLVNKTYNARGALLGTTTYTVGEFSENQSSNATLIRVAVTDSLNTTIDKGYIDVNCENGTFFIKQAYSSLLSPEVIPMLSMSTELLGDFMDYPDTFNDDYPFPDFITFLRHHMALIDNQLVILIKRVAQGGASEKYLYLRHVCAKEEKPFRYNKRGCCQ